MNEFLPAQALRATTGVRNFNINIALISINIKHFSISLSRDCFITHNLSSEGVLFIVITRVVRSLSEADPVIFTFLIQMCGSWDNSITGESLWAVKIRKGLFWSRIISWPLSIFTEVPSQVIFFVVGFSLQFSQIEDHKVTVQVAAELGSVLSKSLHWRVQANQSKCR